MVPRLVALAVVGACLAPTAAAEDVVLNVTALDDGGQYWFRFEDEPAPNPTLDLRAGDRVTVELFNGGRQVHNIHFGPPINARVDWVMPGERMEVTFTVDGGVHGQTEYWCDPHKQLLMRGPVLLGGFQPGDDDPQETTPLLPVLAVLAVVATAAGLVRRGRRGGGAR